MKSRIFIFIFAVSILAAMPLSAKSKWVVLVHVDPIRGEAKKTTGGHYHGSVKDGLVSVQVGKKFNMSNTLDLITLLEVGTFDSALTFTYWTMQGYDEKTSFNVNILCQLQFNINKSFFIKPGLGLSVIFNPLENFSYYFNLNTISGPIISISVGTQIPIDSHGTSFMLEADARLRNWGAFTIKEFRIGTGLAF